MTNRACGRSCGRGGVIAGESACSRGFIMQNRTRGFPLSLSLSLSRTRARASRFRKRPRDANAGDKSSRWCGSSSPARIMRARVEPVRAYIHIQPQCCMYRCSNANKLRCKEFLPMFVRVWQVTVKKQYYVFYVDSGVQRRITYYVSDYALFTTKSYRIFFCWMQSFEVNLLISCVFRTFIQTFSEMWNIN